MVAGVRDGAMVSIHDVSGRVVRTLAMSGQQSAVISLVWDGRDSQGRRCAAGVYVVKLTSESGCLTGRAVLTR
jgi:flagellar hook assembly protein FlgD